MTELTLQSPVVALTLRGPNRSGGALKDAVVMTIEGRRFLSGVSLSTGNWTYGRRMHVALDEIAMMVEFDSEAAYAAMRARRGSNVIRRLFGRS